jgi:hypothetical protein
VQGVACREERWKTRGFLTWRPWIMCSWVQDPATLALREWLCSDIAGNMAERFTSETNKKTSFKAHVFPYTFIISRHFKNASCHAEIGREILSGDATHLKRRDARSCNLRNPPWCATQSNYKRREYFSVVTTSV